MMGILRQAEVDPCAWRKPEVMRKYLVIVSSLLAYWYLVGSGAALAAEPLKIGALFALSGDGAEGQVSTIAGVRLAVAEINAQGGVLGRPLEVVWGDDQNTPIGAHLAAMSLVDARVAAMIGPARSSNAMIAGKIAQARQIPMLVISVTAPEVTRIGDYIFRSCFTDDFQGRILAQFARTTLHAQTAILVKNVSSDYSLGLARVFGETFIAQGGEIVAEIEYLQQHKDFRALLTPLTALAADVLFAPGYSESGMLVKQARELGLTAIPIGGDGWTTQAFLNKGGNTIPRGYYLSHWSPELDRPQSRRFVATYGHLYALDSGMALAYDAVWLLADAIRRAQTSEPQAIRAALAATLNFSGVTGEISFAPHGDPVKPAVLMEILDGRPHLFQQVTP